MHLCWWIAGCMSNKLSSVDELSPRWNGRHFAEDTLKCIFLNEKVRIFIKISLKFIPKGPINNIPALVQIMAWCRPGGKPLSEPMLIRLLMHMCITRPQWVKTHTCCAIILLLTYHDQGCPMLSSLQTIFSAQWFFSMNSWSPWWCACNLNVWLTYISWSELLLSWAFHIKFSSGEWHRTPLMTSQHWFRDWQGGVRQGVITVSLYWVTFVNKEYQGAILLCYIYY